MWGTEGDIRFSKYFLSLWLFDIEIMFIYIRQEKTCRYGLDRSFRKRSSHVQWRGIHWKSDAWCSSRKMQHPGYCSQSTFLISHLHPEDIYALKELMTLSWITTLLWWKGLRNSMKLWAMTCRAIQDGQVVVKSSDKVWYTGEGNSKPF